MKQSKPCFDFLAAFDGAKIKSGEYRDIDES